MSRDPVSDKDGGALVRLRVSPGAKRPELRGLYGGSAVKLPVTAPPVDGKANVEAVRVLARLVGVAASNVQVLRGFSARDKDVFVDGVCADEVRGALGLRR